MKMTKRIAAMAVCAVMTLSTAMSVTASSIDTSEQLTSISESANATITVINSISNYSKYAVKQIGDGSCWAACILSVLKYHDYRTTETFETIYTRANRLTGSNMSVGDTILTSKMPVIINDYLGMSNLGSIGSEEIYNHIAANEPLIGSIAQGNNLNHLVVIYGFEGIEVNGILHVENFRIMDPVTGTCSTINLYDYYWTAFYGYSSLI